MLLYLLYLELKYYEPHQRLNAVNDVDKIDLEDLSNNLVEVETVLNSEAVLIGRPENLSKENQEILDELLFRIEAVKAAETQKYVLMNVPCDKVSEVVSILPGMRSPTILPLADDKWCSIHAVVNEKHFWEVIGRIKAAGAEGILVLDIEKMVL